MSSAAPSNVLELSVPRPQLALLDVDKSIEFARTFEVTDAASAEIAEAERMFFDEQEKLLEAKLEEIYRPIKAALDSVRSWFNPGLAKCKQGKALWNTKLARYYEAIQERKRAAEIQAREIQRVEQQRLAHDAAKREEDARVEAEKLRAQAQLQAAAGNTTASAELARRAEHAEVAGQQDAQQLIEQLNLTPAPTVPQEALPSGVSARKVWSEVDVYDLAELVVACAEGKQPMAYVLPNLVRLRQSAVALKEEFNVPGVRVRPKTVIATKSSR